MNTDYSQFYRGTTSIKSYGNEVGRKDTLVKYEFHTTGEQGNKVMDKMSRQETMQTMNAISSQYGENVIVEFSGDGLAALVESKKNGMDQLQTEEQIKEKEARQTAFNQEVVHYDKRANDLPAYSGIYNVDKTIATAIQNGNKEEQGFVYDIIRQNFLVEDANNMSEEERQANISLGMKKAEYAAENFVPEDKKQDFLKAMQDIAKLASAGKKDENGIMDYGINQIKYLGHGSNLVATTNVLDMMKKTDSKAYKEYQQLGNSEDTAFHQLKNLTNWYADSVSKNQNLVQNYEKKNDDYISDLLKKQSVSKAFDKLDTTSKTAFLDSLKKMQSEGSNFSSLIQRERSRSYWNK